MQEIQITALPPVTIAEESHPRTTFGKEVKYSIDSKLFSSCIVHTYSASFLKNGHAKITIIPAQWQL